MLSLSPPLRIFFNSVQFFFSFLSFFFFILTKILFPRIENLESWLLLFLLLVRKWRTRELWWIKLFLNFEKFLHRSLESGEWYFSDLWEGRRKRKVKSQVGGTTIVYRGVAINARTKRGGARSWEWRKRGNTFEFYWPGVTDSSRFQVPLKNPTWLNFWSNYSQLNKHPAESQLNNSPPHENSKAGNLGNLPPPSLRFKYTTTTSIFFFSNHFSYFLFLFTSFLNLKIVSNNGIK